LSFAVLASAFLILLSLIDIILPPFLVFVELTYRYISLKLVISQEEFSIFLHTELQV
jgi:hypothetical protein